MTLIKVQYDGYNRQFKLLDRDLVGQLEDGTTYLVIADVSTRDVVSSANVATQCEMELVGGS